MRARPRVLAFPNNRYWRARRGGRSPASRDRRSRSGCRCRWHELWPLRLVASGAGVGGNVSHLSAAIAGRATRTNKACEQEPAHELLRGDAVDGLPVSSFAASGMTPIPYITRHHARRTKVAGRRRAESRCARRQAPEEGGSRLSGRRLGLHFPRLSRAAADQPQIGRLAAQRGVRLLQHAVEAPARHEGETSQPISRWCSTNRKRRSAPRCIPTTRRTGPIRPTTCDRSSSSSARRCTPSTCRASNRTASRLTT